MISIEDFKKVEIKVGKVLMAERIENSEKLLKLSVDFGEQNPRQVISGIAKYIDPEKIIGKLVAFVTNLEPRPIMGFESQAMILAIASEDSFSLLEVEQNIKEGSIVK